MSAFGQNFEITEEQKEILSYPLNPTDAILINSVAGTGKTTTIIEFVKKNAHLKFLMLKFNRAVTHYLSETKAAANLTISTWHSLAWRFQCGTHPIDDDIFWTKVLPYLKHVPASYEYQYSNWVIDTIKNYITSGDSDLDRCHISDTQMPRQEGQEQLLIDDARTIWSKLIDSSDHDLFPTNDCYMKLFKKSQPQFDYDCIIVDGFEDCSPAMLHILFSQNCSKFLLGDANQEIYGFRKAVNALDYIADRCTVKFNLTLSFRFGPEVSSLLCMILELWGGDRRLIPVPCNTQNGGVLPGKIGILSRTTKALEDLHGILFSNYPKRPADHTGRTFAFLGGIQNSEARKITPGYRERVKGADVIFSTVYKAKGLEFDTVFLLDDFGDLTNYVGDGSFVVESFEFLYTAVTRAKTRVFMTRAALSVILFALQCTASPICCLNDKQEPVRCMDCNSMFIPAPWSFFLVRPFDGGFEKTYLCEGCFNIKYIFSSP